MHPFRRYALAFLGVLCACALVSCSVQHATLSGIVITPQPDVSRVSLPDVSRAGKPFTMRAASGDLLLVYFGYTSCPDICPTTLSDISVALYKLGTRADRVSVAMATVDPGRDTAKVLTAYLADFFNTSHALRTDDSTELTQAATAFGVKFQIAPHARAVNYSVSHTAITFVVDDHGRVIDEWPFGIKPAAMLNDLQILLRRHPVSTS